MPNGYMIVTEEDWKEANENQRSWMLFNTMQKMNCRVKKLEKRPIVDKVWAFAGGIIGGAAAFLGLKVS